MKNLLTLHEAVAVILLSQENRSATFQTVAQEIERRNLFPVRKGGITLAEQVKIRTSIKSNKYKYLFDFIPPDTIRLK